MQTNPAPAATTTTAVVGVEASGPNSTRGPEQATLAATRELILEAVGHRFDQLEVISELDLRVAPGETVALVGPSGCGKSTALELIAGLVEPSAGRISIAGATAAQERLQHAVYMPQRDQLLPWLRAVDNAALPLRLSGASRRDSRARARALLSRLGLDGFERARPDELSGGMRQRVAFARTLLAGKPVLLLDEPFASLDAITRADLQEWLLEALEAEPRTVVLVTHDVEEALFVADRTIVLTPRPMRSALELTPPRSAGAGRAAVISDPAFVETRERALRALAGDTT